MVICNTWYGNHLDIWAEGKSTDAGYAFTKCFMGRTMFKCFIRRDVYLMDNGTYAGRFYLLLYDNEGIGEVNNGIERFD